MLGSATLNLEMHLTQNKQNYFNYCKHVTVQACVQFKHLFIIWFYFLLMTSQLFCSPDGLFSSFFSFFFTRFCRLSYTAPCWESYNLFKAGQEQLSAELDHTLSIGATEHQRPEPAQPIGFEKGLHDFSFPNPISLPCAK